MMRLNTRFKLKQKINKQEFKVFNHLVDLDKQEEDKKIKDKYICLSMNNKTEGN